MNNDLIIVDSHCHLDMINNNNNTDIITRANNSGVRYLQTICTKIENFNKIKILAEQFCNVFASVGIHPLEVNNSILYQQLVTLSKHKKIISFGETGLDYFNNISNNQKTLQYQSFQQHIYAAQTTNLPIVIHNRNSDDDLIKILSTEKKYKDFSGVIHCFTSSTNIAKKVLDLGMYISISGIVTFKNAAKLQDTIKYIPLDKLLLETDAPFLAPVPKRGTINEPSFLKYTLEFIANQKDITTQLLANYTTNNFFSLFKKAQR